MTPHSRSLVPFVLLLACPGAAVAQVLFHDPAGKTLVAEDAKWEVLAKDRTFTEGPVWLAAEARLVFSDIPAGKLLQWTEAKGVQDFMPAAKSNGNTLDLQGRLVTCQHEARNVVRLEADGKWTALAERFDGKLLNSPNDVAVRNDGTIWFTDPTYGLERRTREQKDNGVYRLDPASGVVTLVQTEFHQPNGICFAPDQQRVYIADSGRKARIGAFPVEDGTLGKALFWIEGGADGMRCDEQGNLYAAQFDCIHVFSPAGKRLLEIECPELPTNCAFGGADGKTLFVTARRFLLRMQVKVAGAPVPPLAPKTDPKAK